jgi:uncharacterized Tic20 family protein
VSTEAVALPIPTADERKMAMLAHVLQLFGGFIAPLIIFLIKKDSKFVRFHALQPLIWQCVLMVLSMVLMMGFMMSMFLAVPFDSQQKPGGPPPVGFFIFFGGFWFLMMLQWGLNLFLAIFFGIKSYEGAWSRYPLIGRLAAAWSGI